MNKHKFLLFLSLPTALMASNASKKQSKTTKIGKPNIILILCDDLGYADIEPFGAQGIKTPNLNQLASEGLTLTNFYAGSAVSSPSRAALLTGCYPNRIGIPDVLAPHGLSWSKDLWRVGLNSDEQTLPELLKTQGYATAIFGKWHLGHLSQHLPNKHGFDEFWGIPYSNDMIPQTDANYPPLPIIHNNIIEEENPDQTQFTKRFTDKTLQYIDQHADKPFFIFLTHPMPHVPISASDKFKNSSEKGLYGDVIQEIDASVGQILAKLKDKNIRENTIVIFTSDNGPWLAFGNHAGSALPLREGKHTSMEGGYRVPFIINWPKKIQQNSKSNEMVSAMDLLPTLTCWANAPLPTKKIDGLALNAFFEGKTSFSARKNLLYYHSTEVEAIRVGKWKLHIPHSYQKAGSRIGNNGLKGYYDKAAIGLELFNLINDPAESENLANKYPKIVEKLHQLLLKMDLELKLNKRLPAIYEGEAPPIRKLWW